VAARKRTKRIGAPAPLALPAESGITIRLPPEVVAVVRDRFDSAVKLYDLAVRLLEDARHAREFVDTAADVADLLRGDAKAIGKAIRRRRRR
jgi:hypothetical protein